MPRPLETIATKVYAALLATRPLSVSAQLVGKVRQLLVRLGDPPVTLPVAGSALRMPLSHDLPLYRASFPLYSDNLRRLVAACAAKYPDLSVVDIGANIGDSVALLRGLPFGAVLCVEGDPRYLTFLRANTADLGGRVMVAPVLVGAETGEIQAELVASRGTAGLRVGGGVTGAVRTLSLDDLIKAYPLPGPLKVLKSDTDGFEARILEGGLATLRRSCPVLFFEYDPRMLAGNASDGLGLLATIERAAGYRTALIYDNVGDLLVSVRLDDVDLLTELHRYLDRSGRYVDIAAFHGDDADLFEKFRSSEHDFYAAQRSGGGAGPPSGQRPQ